MTFACKFIQEEGARKVHNGYHCVPHEIVLSMMMIPFQNEKMGVHKRFLKPIMN
jgi:hypothetical protein